MEEFLAGLKRNAQKETQEKVPVSDLSTVLFSKRYRKNFLGSVSRKDFSASMSSFMKDTKINSAARNS